MSYLEGLRIGAVGVVTGLAFLNEEIDQVESTEGDKSNKEVLPVLTQVMKTTYRDCKAWEEEGKAYNKGEDAVQTDEAINEASYEANDEGAECIAPVFTAACTATEILVLKSNGFLEILEDTFFLHESFSRLRVDECD